MANRSTFNRSLPRDLGKLVALSSDGGHYVKRQLAPAFDSRNGAPILDADGKQVHKFVVLPDYERMVRGLFMDAHKHHRAFKNKRLAKEVVADLKTVEATEPTAVAA